jgi:transcriptional regulator with XRE-family HTH domain
MNIFASRLKQARKSKGYTQIHMANFLGVIERTYQHYEQGQTEPKLDAIHKLSDYLNVSVDYLLGKSDDPNPTGDTGEYKYLAVFSLRAIELLFRVDKPMLDNILIDMSPEEKEGIKFWFRKNRPDFDLGEDNT